VKSKPLIPRVQARWDVEAIVEYYLTQRAERAALGFIDSLQKGYAHIARCPATGSPRHGQALDLAGLRSWPLAKYPYIVFYLDHPDHVDVIRVLHAQKDIPAWLQAVER
jgi:toxin ParE1/3/4